MTSKQADAVIAKWQNPKPEKPTVIDVIVNVSNSSRVR